MIQIYWAGWERARWLWRREKWDKYEISLRWTLYLGPLHISYYHVHRFGEDFEDEVVSRDTKSGEAHG